MAQATQSGKRLVIRCRGVTKAFGKGAARTPVLHGVSLDIEQGECVFLAGPSGSGKSTLLSIVGCILSPDAGEIQILDEDVSRLPSRQKARFRRKRIGFAFQRFHLFRGLKAWENVRVPLDLLGWTAQEARKESCRLLEAVGLANRAFHHVDQLSVGQRQRVALARALAGEPDLILADEPTASLDAQSGQVAMELLKDLCRERGKTCVVVTHDTRIFPQADRIIHLEDGRIMPETPSAAIDSSTH